MTFLEASVGRYDLKFKNSLHNLHARYIWDKNKTKPTHFMTVETGLVTKGHNGHQQPVVVVSAIIVCKRTPALSHPPLLPPQKNITNLSNNSSPISFDCIVSSGRLIFTLSQDALRRLMFV